MVMFRDEELAMIRAERAARPRWRKILSRAVKTLLWACLLFYVCLLILSRAGGRSDAMKTGLEQYLSQATGMNAHIGYLNHMAFYPLAGVDFDDLTLTPPRGTGPAVRVGHARIVMRFWDLLASRSAFAALDVADLRADAGTLDARPMAIDAMAIDGPGAAPRLTLRGEWGGQALRAGMDLKSHGGGVTFASPTPFTLGLGDTTVKGTASWTRGQSGLTVTFDAATPSLPAAKGSLTLKPDRNGQQADMRLNTTDGTLSLRLTRRHGQMFDGAIDARATDARAIDAPGAARLIAWLETLAKLVPRRPDLHAVFPAQGSPCRGALTLGAEGKAAPAAPALCAAR